MNRQNKFKAATAGTRWLLNNLELHSPYGREALKNLRPARESNLPALQLGFAELEKLVDYLQKNHDFSSNLRGIFASMRNINGSISNLSQEIVPDETELLEIKNFAMLIDSLSSLYIASGLNLQSVSFASMQAVIKLLNPDKTLLSSFHLHDAYSETLKQLRKNKLELEAAILSASNLHEKDRLRSERAAVVLQEKAEEFKVRADLGRQLQKWLPQMNHNTVSCGHFELLLAKAQAALRWPSCRPEVFPAGTKQSMQVNEALNPEMIEILEMQGKQFTPVSLELKRGVTMVTGANMGGKTVALLTVAMNAELVTLGFFPYARSFCMPLFDLISVNAGDGQDQHSGLSSFGAEIIHFNEIAAKLKNSSGLAIFDEFARSTNPFEGRRFVQALCDFLQQSSSFGIVATHYDGISLSGAAHYQIVGLKNKNEQIKSDPDTDRRKVLQNLCANMDYRLIKIEGPYEVPKDAFQIATLLETNSEFLQLLKKYYD